MDTIKESFISQYRAALNMLENLIHRCPDSVWADHSVQNPYCRILYHTLFYLHFISWKMTPCSFRGLNIASMPIGWRNEKPKYTQKKNIMLVSLPNAFISKIGMVLNGSIDNAMKVVLFIMGIGLAAIACGQSNTSNTKIAVFPNHLFTKSEADKILGEPTQLLDSSSKVHLDRASYLCSFQAAEAITPQKRRSAIYFLMEDYQQEKDAKWKYFSTKTANEHLGIELLPNLGNEAYFHSDGQNFYFIMVRKGKKVFNIKVNKITHTTSLEAFKGIAKTIAKEI